MLRAKATADRPQFHSVFSKSATTLMLCYKGGLTHVGYVSLREKDSVVEGTADPSLFKYVCTIAAKGNACCNKLIPERSLIRQP
eukprot:4474814-Pyramimonas_sp.AAC.1